MAQRIIGVSKRLIKAASEEFLENGFENSSVRTIAEKGMSFEDARDYVTKLTQFYSAGITTMK